jgi:hypothetical protein
VAAAVAEKVTDSTQMHNKRIPASLEAPRRVRVGARAAFFKKQTNMATDARRTPHDRHPNHTTRRAFSRAIAMQE